MAYLRIASEQVTQVIYVRGNRGYYSTPFYKGWALDDFKKAVPWQARSWDGSSKTWSCELKYLDALKALAFEFGPIEVKDSDEL